MENEDIKEVETKTDKSLKTKAIDIKGKKYVLVSDRVLYFHENYSNGSITTALLSAPDAERVVMKAIVQPDVENDKRFFTGYSQEVIGDGFINKTSALENAETSCVGRALALLGIGVIDSIASVDEINKATSQAQQKPMLAEQGFKTMKEYIQDGKVELVKEKMKNYRIKKVHQLDLDAAIKKVEDKELSNLVEENKNNG